MRGSIRPARDRDGQPRPGVWEIRAYAGKDPENKNRPRQVSRTVHGGRRKAEDALRQLNTDIAAGKVVTTRGTVAALLDRYLRHLEEVGRSPMTLRAYRSAVAHNIVPAIGHMQVRELTAAHLDDLYSQWRRRVPPMKPSTIHQQHSILSGALKQAEKWKWLTYGASPARHATPGNARGSEPDPPTVEELVRFLDVAKARDPMLGDLLHLAALTGARRGELCAIRWSDVDGGRLMIDETVIAVGDQRLTKPTKTDEPRRIALGSVEAGVVHGRIEAQKQQAEEAGVVLVDDPFLFSSRLTGDQPLKPDRVTGFMRRVRTEAGLPHLKTHHLRHWMATEWLGAGVDVVTVAGRLGHSNPNTTYRVYSHFLPERDREAADRLGARLAAPHQLNEGE